MINVRSIPHLYRNVKRWTEILAVLSKYGLADWLAPTNIDFIKDRLSSRAGENIARLTREARIRLTLTELGPTFIKLGQLLSTRPDVVGRELADELKQLQAATPADPPEVGPQNWSRRSWANRSKSCSPSSTSCRSPRPRSARCIAPG